MEGNKPAGMKMFLAVYYFTACRIIGLLTAILTLFQDGKRIFFYTFPLKDYNLLKKVQSKMKLENSEPSKHSSPYSGNFEDCFQFRNFTNTFLKQYSVSTVFSFKSTVKR